MPINIYQYINIYFKQDNLCISICMSNLYISIYIGLDCLPRWEKGRMFWNSSRMSRMQSGSFFVITFSNTTNHHPSDVHSIFVTLLIMISSNILMGSSNSCHYSSKVYLLILCLIGHYDLFWLFWLSIRSCLAAQKSLTFQLLHIQARKIIIFLVILSRR